MCREASGDAHIVLVAWMNRGLNFPGLCTLHKEQRDIPVIEMDRFLVKVVNFPSLESFYIKFQAGKRFEILQIFQNKECSNGNMNKLSSRC